MAEKEKRRRAREIMSIPEPPAADVRPGSGDLADPNKIIRCVKETRPDCGNKFCLWRLDERCGIAQLSYLFDGAEIGEQVVLEYCEMTEAEIAMLPEFDGW
jgi:hypothetical protein